MGDSGVVTVVQMLQMLMGEKKSCGSREVLIDRRNVTGGTHFSYYQQRCELYVTIMLLYYYCGHMSYSLSIPEHTRHIISGNSSFTLLLGSTGPAFYLYIHTT
jgi:hypothetical protein